MYVDRCHLVPEISNLGFGLPERDSNAAMFLRPRDADPPISKRYGKRDLRRPQLGGGQDEKSNKGGCRKEEVSKSR